MAWFRVVAPTSSPAHELGSVLRARGLHDGGPAQPAEPGVVVVDGVADEALSALGPILTGRLLVALAPSARADPWELLRAGAADVIPVGDGADVPAILARLERWAAVEELIETVEVREVAVGTSARWRELLREVVEIARFTRSPVLVTGETGTGKEVVARLIDRLDPRPDRPELEIVDCTTIVPTLMGSELFGHEKGAFTGATGARPGAFAQADGGTLFLDEVGELPIELQPALLRVVQEGTYKSIGNTRWRTARFRLLAATNRDLSEEMAAGRFRRDLYYRLAAATVRVPPLRERPEDVVPLFRHFLRGADPDRVRTPDLTPEVASALTARSYPGNVRDLRQLALRVAARHVGDGPITPGDLPPEDRPTVAVAVAAATPTDWLGALERAVSEALAAGVGLQRLKEATADVATRVALARVGSTSAAARLLGVSRRAVDYRTNGRTRPEGTRQRPSESSPTSS